MGWVQKKRGRYVARVKVNGTETSKSFDRERDAKAWLREREGLRPTGRRMDNVILLTLVERRAELAEGSTRVGREHLAENLGDLGVMRLADVTTDDVRAWRAGLAAGRDWANGKPLKSSTISTLTRHLSAVFNEAVANGQIPRNPVRGARKGGGHIASSGVVDPADVMTLYQLRRILREAPEPLRTMFELAATSGLRPNEVAGLRVRSIDFDRKTVNVIEQADGDYEAWGWGPLKSETSRRRVPLPDSTLKRLQTHLDSHPDYVPGSPLFRTERGYQWSTAHIGNRWRAIAKAARVEGHSPKSLRHFYASKLIDAGESVTVVQKRMGHASPTVTLTVYAHLFPEADAATRAVFDDLI